ARCPHAMKLCQQQPPPAFAHNTGTTARCWLQHPDAPRVSEDIIQGAS
ncbi:MAG: peptide ABC transporter ATP-binding protein, partial [Gammaproteobacteria bacterium]